MLVKVKKMRKTLRNTRFWTIKSIHDTYKIVSSLQQREKEDGYLSMRSASRKLEQEQSGSVVGRFQTALLPGKTKYFKRVTNEEPRQVCVLLYAFVKSGCFNWPLLQNT